MSFRNWIASLIWRKTKPEEGQVSDETQKLKMEITEISKEYQGLLEEYEDIAQKLKSEIAEINYAYQKARNKLEKEREIIAIKDKEIESERNISSELRKELEIRTNSIRGYEESIQKLKNELAEMNKRYQEASERLNAEMDNAISLEMLILELDRELGLTNIVKRIEKNKEPVVVQVKNSRKLKTNSKNNVKLPLIRKKKSKMNEGLVASSGKT